MDGRFTCLALKSILVGKSKDFIEWNEDMEELDFEELLKKVNRIACRKRLEKEIDGLRRELASKASGDLLDSVQDIGGIKEETKAT